MSKFKEAETYIATYKDLCDCIQQLRKAVDEKDEKAVHGLLAVLYLEEYTLMDEVFREKIRFADA